MAPQTRGVTGRTFSPVVVAPTFDNARTLAGVVGGIRETGLPLIVVNDGSTDSSGSILRELASGPGGDVVAISHPTNRGKAAALATGFAAAAEMGCSHAVSIDTDGQLNPASIPALVELARQHPRALILGARQWRIPRCPLRSVVGRAVSGVAVWCQSGRWVSDTQCGLRVYPLELVGRTRCGSGRFAFETEIITRALWAGWPVIETPVDCVYLPPGERVSHFRPWRDTLAGAALHVRLGLAALGARARRRARRSRSLTPSRSPFGTLGR
jgi:glycosyltransferase involved in cell wall biosynthesis